MDTSTPTLELDKHLDREVTRLFNIEQKHLASGDIMCTLSFRSVRHGHNEKAYARIEASMVADPTYVDAVIRAGLDTLLKKILRYNNHYGKH